MSVQNHLAELERRHQAIERELDTEMTHPATSDMKISELKRRKLLLKDEIQKLRDAMKAPSIH